MQEITYRTPDFYEALADDPRRHVHLIMIATKPDIIKQIPVYKALKRRGQQVVLGHTGQHYDENLSGGMLKEFGVEPDFNLHVRGPLYEIVSDIIRRLGFVMDRLRQSGKVVIPYVHGDTSTSAAASNAAFCQGFASVHVEAGLRTLTPRYTDFSRWDDLEAWHAFLQKRENWDRGSLEPYPEQYNTRCSEAGSGIHLAPVELNREFLKSEGFPQDRIAVVGNSVVDAQEESLANLESSDIFERYPALRDGNFVRFCVHRRENCTSERRFRAIYEAMTSFIKEGRTVLLISLFQTEDALRRYGLKAELESLREKCPNFVYTPVWPQYRDVMAAMQRAAVCATDSGSMQEEMNLLRVPCVTLRFGSDRSESAINGGNLIAPPTDGVRTRRIIDHAWNNQAMRQAKPIYGESVSERSVDFVLKVLEDGEVFRTEEQRLRLDQPVPSQ